MKFFGRNENSTGKSSSECASYKTVWKTPGSWKNITFLIHADVLYCAGFARAKIKHATRRRRPCRNMNVSTFVSSPFSTRDFFPHVFGIMLHTTRWFFAFFLSASFLLRSHLEDDTKRETRRRRLRTSSFLFVTCGALALRRRAIFRFEFSALSGCSPWLYCYICCPVGGWCAGGARRRWH